MIYFLALFLSLQAPQKTDSPSERPQPSANEQRGSDSLPITVKLLNTGESEDDAKTEAQRIRDERIDARRTIRLTEALVWATSLTLIVLVFQSYYLRRSVAHAEQSEERQLRAYIFVDESNWKESGIEW